MSEKAGEHSALRAPVMFISFKLSDKPKSQSAEIDMTATVCSSMKFIQLTDNELLHRHFVLNYNSSGHLRDITVDCTS